MVVFVFCIGIAMAQDQALSTAAAKLEGIALTADQIATLDMELRGHPEGDLLQLAHAYQWGTSGRIKQHGFAAVLLQYLLGMNPGPLVARQAQFELGWMFLYGLGVARNHHVAMARFQNAASAGQLQAQIELGWMHQFGQATARDPSLARSYFQAAAEAGSDHARWLAVQLKAPPPSDSPIASHRITEPLTGMPFRLISAGHFRREAVQAPNQKAFSPHRVTITQPFWMGTFEVTQSQWRRIMGGKPSYDDGCESCPVTGINWYQAQAFIQRLNLISPLSGFRLPTEAEWEYACRAGTTTAFHFGQSLQPHQANADFRDGGNASGKFHGRPQPVGTYPANAWGLHDMHGNVLEWCQDDFCSLTGGAQIDPIGKCTSGMKTIRGGSWFFAPTVAQSGYRDFHRPQDLGRSLGLRLVKDVLPPAP